MNDTTEEKEAFYKDARTDIPGPLHGVKVLEIATTWAGPRCGQVLADYGADVVKIEWGGAPDVARRLPPTMPGTDPPDGYLHATVNRNKRDITLDLHMAEGREVYLKLAAGVDIVVENFKKGTLAGWGCGYADVKAVKPDIVFVSITAFGQYGPYSDRPGYDPVAQALSGFVHMNARTEDDPPLKAPTFLADDLGGLHGAMGALAALRHRDATGEGQHVDISLVDAMIDSSTGLHTMAANGLPTPRLGNTFSFSAPATFYPCRDGWVFAGVVLDAHWKVLAGLIGRPELADHPVYSNIRGRMSSRAELDEMLGAWCLGRTRDEITTLFEQAGLPAGPVLTPAETTVDPQIKARDAIQEIETADGLKQKIPAPAAKFSRTPVRIRTPAPALGADTDAVLEEAGFGAEERAALREKGVIA